MKTCKMCGFVAKTDRGLLLHIAQRHRRVENVQQEEGEEMSDDQLLALHEKIAAIDKALTESQLREQQEVERLKNSIAELSQKVKQAVDFSDDMRTLCDRFPSLCEKVDQLEKRAKVAQAPVAQPAHETAAEFWECPQCSRPLAEALPNFPEPLKAVLKKTHRDLLIEELKGAGYKVVSPGEAKKSKTREF